MMLVALDKNIVYASIQCMVTKTLEKNKFHKNLKVGNDVAYQTAWKHFEIVSKKLRRLWRTKKNSASILREERGW